MTTPNVSRQDLLDWVNSLLQLNMTKIEQCGTGAAFCQILDSIYLDVEMRNVKFNANAEWAYLANFKILQQTLDKHKIKKDFQTENLVKCKMQDNLHLLQWAKQHWDDNYPGGEYDAVARRKGSSMPPSTSSRRTATTGARRGGTTPTTGARVQRAGGGAMSSALQQENNTLKETVIGLERERDFYFAKLRDIELLVQQAVEEDPELEKADDGLIKQIQNILYSTEEGFEIPEGEGLDDQETF